MALENGLSDPLLAPIALLSRLLCIHSLSYVMCGFHAGSGKGRRQEPNSLTAADLRVYGRTVVLPNASPRTTRNKIASIILV